MLVLTRKIGERIVLPECGVSLTVIGIKGKTVRLGIEAPPEVVVYREELLQQASQSQGLPTPAARQMG